MFKNRSIAFKQIVYILSCTLTIFTVIIYHNYVTTKELLTKKEQENAKNLANASVSKINQVFVSIEQIASGMTRTLESSSMNEAELKEYVRSTLVANPSIFGVGVAYEPYAFYGKRKLFNPYWFRSKGSLSYMDSIEDTDDYTYEDWYQISRETGKPIWSEPYFDKDSNVVMATYSLPFYKIIGSKRVLSGIVLVDISLEWLQQQTAAIKILDTGYCLITSSSGRYVAHPNPKRVPNESIFAVGEGYGRPLYRAMGREMIKGRSGVAKFDSLQKREMCTAYYMPIGSTGWSIAVIYPDSELLAELNKLHRNVIIMTLIGIAALMIVIIFITNRITRPLKKLVSVTKVIGHGNFNLKLPEPDAHDEIGELTSSFNAMQGALNDYIEHLKDTTAAKEKIESELSIARDIQRSIVPKLFPAFPEREEFEVYAILESAKAVGGDLYDFFFIDENHLFIAIGDVSGKGVPASLFMAVTQTLTRAKAEKTFSPSEILAGTNKELCKDNELAMFVTYFMGILNLSTGEMDICNAGHNRPYIINKNAADNPVKLDGIHGLPLGTLENPYSMGKIVLKPGDTLFLYTDGVTEAFNSNEEQFTESRLEKLLADNVGLNPKALTEHVLAEVKKFAGDCEQSDDITIEAITYRGRAKPHIIVN